MKMGAEKVLAMLKGVAQKVLGYSLCGSHIVGGGGAKSFHSLKGGAQTVLPCLEGGRKKFRTHDFPIL